MRPLQITVNCQKEKHMLKTPILSHNHHDMRILLWEGSILSLCAAVGKDCEHKRTIGP